MDDLVQKPLVGVGQFPRLELGVKDLVQVRVRPLDAVQDPDRSPAGAAVQVLFRVCGNGIRGESLHGWALE